MGAIKQYCLRFPGQLISKLTNQLTPAIYFFILQQNQKYLRLFNQHVSN
jgi:hypothetical protein